MIDQSPNQKAFIESDAKHIRLLAPAGSGKTQSLLWRCLYLHEQNPKSKFLLLTFTKGAREELEKRLSSDEFKPLKNFLRIETLNSYGKNRLSGGKYHTKPIAKRNLVKDFLKKPIIDKIKKESFKQKLTEVKFRDYNKMIDIFDCLKICGFTHISESKVALLESFSIHTKCSEKLSNKATLLSEICVKPQIFRQSKISIILL